ncbi:MAG: 3'-5' exonuclease [Bacteroidota bacterium]
MKFYALDVETANPDQSTICQIGIGVFEDGSLVDTWKSYIDPQDYFHWRFIEIHGITPKMVKRKPTFPKVYPILRQMLENQIVVHHSPFDRVAFGKAFDKYGLEPFDVKWLDSVQVARKTWVNLEGGYNLANLAMQLGIEFRHHDALEDAVACGRVVLWASNKTSIGNIIEWFDIL